MNADQVTILTHLTSLGKQLTAQNANGCAPIGARRSLEHRYGQAYKQAVDAGLRLKLRKKYRG